MTAPFCEKHDWCQEHDDHQGREKEPDRAHVGETVTLSVPPHMEPTEDDPLFLLKVQIWSADASYPTPRAYLADDVDELSMTAGQLGEFIDQLDAFREALTTIREQLTQAQAVAQ